MELFANKYFANMSYINLRTDYNISSEKERITNMYTNYYNNQSPNTYLIHYGVKGMKWGVRHDIDKAGYSRSKVYSNLEKTKQNYKDSKSEYGRSSEKTIKARSQYKNAKKRI